ncbi:MAG: SDR family oxidoreductase [Bacteroidetes bacterium]|nr:SDR family oxidoreductase [Bacteroidota bacterium]
MRILITGGAGYLGHSLIQELQRKQPADLEEIVVYDNLSRKSYAFFYWQKLGPIPCRFIEADLLDERSLMKALEGIDTVVHLAAKVTTPFADHESHFYDQINHWGTAILANCIQGSAVRRVVHMSSASIYGRSDTPVDEDHIPSPFSFYGISKRDAEKQINLIGNQCDLYILRAGNVYGFNPSLRIDAVINKYMFNAHFNGRITLNGDGSQQRPFIHVDKLAWATCHCLAGLVLPGVYNVLEHNYSVNQIVAYIKHLYQALEVLSINPNVPMPRVSVKTPARIWQQVPLPDRSFLEELQDFKAAFAF